MYLQFTGEIPFLCNYLFQYKITIIMVVAFCNISLRVQSNKKRINLLTKLSISYFRNEIKS